jgi:hypothetical protein
MIGLDFLGAADAPAPAAASHVFDTIKARIPPADLDALQKDIYKDLVVEFDTSAPAEEQKKMALRTFDSTLRAAEKFTSFAMKYCKGDECAALLREANEGLSQMLADPNMPPEQKAVVAESQKRVADLGKGAGAVSLDFGDVGKVVGGAFGGSVKGATYGAAIGAVLLAFLWKSNRIAGALLGGLVVGPAVGAPVGFYFGAKRGAKEAGIEEQPKLEAAKPAPALPAAKPAAPAAKPVAFKIGDKIKGKDVTGKFQLGKVAKVNYGSPDQVWVVWSDGSGSIASTASLARA